MAPGAVDMATIATLALLAGGWNQPTETDTLQGKATYMTDARMRGVLEYRDSELSLSMVVALNRAGDRGRWVWLEWPDGSIDGPLLVVDCAQKIHFERRQRWGNVAEVSAELAQERGFYGVGPTPVTVWFKPPEMRWK